MDPAKLKVVELRAQLSQRGLDTKGNKAVLVERLRKALEEETENESQEKSNITTEDSGDTTLKETNEIVVESSKSVQPPKTPGRSSRSSSVTPTKISTRSGPKLVLTPVSIKQSTPNKVQHIEKVSEVLTTISEIDSEEPMMDKIERDQTTPPPEKDHGKEDPAITISTQNEVHVMTDNESKETLNDSKNEKSDSQIVTSMQSSDQSSENLPKSDTMQECDNQQITSEPLEEEHIDVDNVEKKVEAVQEDAQKTYETEQVECFEKDEIELNESSQHDNENTEMETDMSDDTNKEQISVDDIATDQPSVSTAETEDKMDVDDSEHEQKVQLNESHENKDNISSEETELTETHINYVSVDEAQNTEMVEDKITKNVTDDNNRETKDSNNRKRKRSPSPVERQKSPTPIKIENEPELDDSVVTLSWYDSDLNLIINQDGFLSATPLHSDGFCYMWAGARASHGYTYGKIYYETKITELCPINVQDDEYPHALRVGWSTPQTSMQLGERKFSYAYSSTGKKCTENNFEDYGVTFSKDDIVCCYLDMTLENDIILSYSINGKYLGTAFSISKEEIGDKALYPHILSKNCSFSCNFGQEKPWSEEILEEYIPIGDLSIVDKIPGPKRPEKKEDCEIIMMCGLPASGKTVWATKHATEYPDKLYNILGINSLINKMNYMGLPRKQSYHGKWEVLIDKCTHALNKLLEMASSRRRNYILDQANIYPSAQRRKMKHFSGYQRKAVVVIPEDEEFKSRLSNHEAIDGKNISDSGIMEMKANFSAPDVGESFNAVEWVELDKEEGRKLIMKYNKEGKEAGFGQQHASKRIRFDRMESNRDSRDLRNNRDTRDNRNHRDRRNNYPDRSRNPPWRGGNMGNWRDRPQRGNHMRHGGGYGGPPGGRRGRGAPIPPSHRGIDRRGGGSGDRRSNNRNRSSIRQGGRGTMSNYQGSQFNWNQQGNWSNNQPQQGGWVQEWDQQQYNWKSYNQGTYGQNNYNQQGGYGNGNWSNWNQQYYNQYWNQQQQTGQTATAAGGQATSTTAGITGTTSNSLVRYSYPQEWQEYTQAYTLPGESATTNAQQSQQHK